MFQFENIDQYHRALDTGETTCKEIVEHYLKKIAERNSLNAFVSVYADEALEKAQQLDEKRKSAGISGKLYGVVMSIKDVLGYRSHPLSAASKMLDGFNSIYTATAVQRLLDEGAIIIGSCNCDEFAMGSTNEHSHYGRVKNPYNESLVSGGSSGGSAVSVSAGLCMASLGSDTGGSVRQPADFCGIIGFKPSYGTISRHGLVAYASSFDQVGIFSNSIDDVSRILDVISGPDEFDSTVNQEKPRIFSEVKAFEDLKIGVFTSAVAHPSLDKEISREILKLTEDLQGEVAVIDSINFDLIDYVVPAYYVLTTAEASANLSRYDGVRYGYRSELPAPDLETFYKQNRSEGFGWEVKKRIMLGTYVLSEGYFDAYFTKAQKVRNMLVTEAVEIFNKYDIVLMPTVTSTAFAAGTMEKDPVAMYLADIFTVFANLTGIPAVSLPLFTHSNKMPFGIQALAAKNNEVNLLGFSATLMEKIKQS